MVQEAEAQALLEGLQFTHFLWPAQPLISQVFCLTSFWASEFLQFPDISPTSHPQQVVAEGSPGGRGRPDGRWQC